MAHLKHFEYAANVVFEPQGACLAPLTQANKNDYFPGDIRVVLQYTSVSGTGLVPGKGCNYFRDDNGAYNGKNDGWTSWGIPPGTAAATPECMYNLKLADEPGGADPPYVNHTLHEFGHALGLAHEHERTDVNPRLCAASWVFWLHNPSTWPAASLLLGSQSYAKSELLTVLQNSGEKPDDASIQLAHPLIAAKLNSFYGTNQPSVSAAIPAGDILLNTRAGKLPYNIGPSSDLGGYMMTTAGQLRSNYGGEFSSGLMTPYDRDSVMHYRFGACGINGNYDYTGLSDGDRLAVHILYPEEVRVAEFVGTTVVQAGTAVRLTSAWKVRGGNVAYVVPTWAWVVDGVIESASPELTVSLAPGAHTLSFTHTDFLTRTYTQQVNITVLLAIDYDEHAAILAAAGVLL